eukprot:1318284-Rhodomonas_salina.1
MRASGNRKNTTHASEKKQKNTEKRSQDENKRTSPTETELRLSWRRGVGACVVSEVENGGLLRAHAAAAAQVHLPAVCVVALQPHLIPRRRDRIRLQLPSPPQRTRVRFGFKLPPLPPHQDTCEIRLQTASCRMVVRAMSTGVTALWRLVAAISGSKWLQTPDT